MGSKFFWGKTLLLSIVASATAHIHFPDLGLVKEFYIGPLPIRFYALAYIFGIFGAYWLVRRMLAQPGAPMADRHTDDLLFYAMLGVIGGGRLGYVLFYGLSSYLDDPISIFKLWDGGMSFHGGVVGVTIAIWWVTRRNGLSLLRVADYVACAVPWGMLLGRLANFINGELWGRASDVPWAMTFCDLPAPAGTCLSSMVARHPSQLYQAALEGALLLAVMTYAFWRTDKRYQPGWLVGLFTLGMGLARFSVEFFREPDAQLAEFAARTGLSMGQWLTIPMILLGIWLMWTAKGRRERIEPVAGPASVA